MTTTTYLLDSSVLIALLMDSHIHRWRVIGWIEASEKKIALCSITQGAFLRVYMRSQESATFEQGIEVLRQLAQMPEVVFLQDNGDYLDVPPRGIRGHRQVTDAYLAQIAKKNDLTLATLDMAQTALYPDTCYYIS
jgi:hypothetical protein